MSLPQNPNDNKANIVAMSLLSTFLSSVVNYPFLRAKQILQAQEVAPAFFDKPKIEGALDCFGRIWREEKFFAFWRGGLPNVLHSVASRYAHFISLYYAQTMDKEDLKDFHLEHAPMTIFGVLSYTLFYPLQFSQVRLALDYGYFLDRKHVGMSDCLKANFKAEGLKGIYQGIWPGVLSILLFQPLFVGGVKLMRDKEKGKSRELMIRGWAIGVKALLYPLEVVRNKLIMTSGNDRVKFNGMIGCLTSTLEKEGIRGLYRGFQIDLALFIPGLILVGILADKSLEKH